MSLLDLNSGKGSSPRMKRGVKLWIGAGLVAAVVGIGSTLATNISLNGGRDNTEFGQGVAQTVYCGDNAPAEVFVTPTSSYVNSEIEQGSAAVPSVWINPSWTGNPTFQEVSSSASTNRFTSTYVNDATGVSESVNGYWVQSSRSSSSWYTTNSTAPANGYVFVPQAVGTSATSYSSRTMTTTASGSNKYGYWKYQSWVAGSFTQPVAAVEDHETNDAFELSGIAITNIPIGCDGVDFVVSVYEPGEDRRAIVSDCSFGHRGDQSYSNEFDASKKACSYRVKEIAVQWTNTDGQAAYSWDRTGISPTPQAVKDLLAVTQTKVITGETPKGGSIKIVIDSDGKRLGTGQFSKIVVETQEDLI